MSVDDPQTVTTTLPDGSTATLQEMGGAQLGTPTSTKLFGGVNQDATNQDPTQPPQCDGGDPFAPLEGLADQIPKSKPKKPLKASATKTGSRPPLKGSASTPGPGNVNLVPGKGTMAPTAPPKTAGVQKTGGSPPIQGGVQTPGGAPLYDPRHPQMGQYVPPNQRKNLPPDLGYTPDGYLYPKEGAIPDSTVDLIIPSLLSGGLINLFTPKVIPTLPPVVTNPPLQEIEEQVWVAVTKNGKIIWHEGETFFQNTKLGGMKGISEAIKEGAREKLPGYYRAGGK